MNGTRNFNLTSLNLRINYSNVGILTSVQDDIDGQTQGRVSIGDQREYISIAPTLTRRLGRRSAFSVGVAYTETNFDLRERPDSQSAAVRATYDYQLTERQTLSLRASYLDSESTGTFEGSVPINPVTGNRPLDPADACFIITNSGDVIGLPQGSDPTLIPQCFIADSFVDAKTENNIFDVGLDYNVSLSEATRIGLGIGTNISETDLTTSTTLNDPNSRVVL